MPQAAVALESCFDRPTAEYYCR